MKRARVTLSDVAKKVGVHPSTVSRVLNPATRESVRKATVELIDQAAKELGYRPNPFAYSLRTARSNTIGIMIPDLTNPVFPPIIRGVEDALSEAHYTAIISNSDNNRQKEKLHLANMRARQVDGLILATAHREDDSVEECLNENIPLVLINRSVEDERVSSVLSNDAEAVEELVTHVAELGHKRIANLAGPQDLSTGYRRHKAFLAAMTKLGLDIDARLIGYSNAFTEEEGRRVMTELIEGDAGFTAVIAGNDLLALGCYTALDEHGLKCPHDISVTGFNDMRFVDKISPPLTTMRIPHYQMGLFATRILLDQIKAPDLSRQNVVLNCEFQLRQSTGPAPSASA
jgi:LacI family transcriptional regulator